MEKIYDLIIIGSGPAGLTAAIYAQRAGLDTLVIERSPMSGGQIINTYEVDNYPGLPGINGFDLAMKMREHADKLGAAFKNASVQTVKDGEYRTVVLQDGSELCSRTIIIAGGGQVKKLGAPGEEKLGGLGVSYCATCDGAFFRKRDVAVVGGGDVAVEDAIFLANICNKVYIIHRRDEFRAQAVLSNALLALENVTPVWNSTVDSIDGDDSVTGITVTNKLTGEKTQLAVDGVFIAVGTAPDTSAYKEVIEIDASGYIVADETGRTSCPGIFAAGDIRKKQLRQIVTAASDGANAVFSVQKYLAGE